MTLASLTYYCDRTDVGYVLSAQGVNLRLDDDQDATVSTAEEAALTFALGDAAETINFYAMHKYTAAWLATSHWVNYRSAILAAYSLCERRGNPVPDSLADRTEKVLLDLERVHEGNHLIPGLPLRMSLLPAWSNVRCDPRYQFRVIRVERRLSSQQPSNLPRIPDYREAFTYEL